MPETGVNSQSSEPKPPSGESVVYVVPREAALGSMAEGISLIDLARIVWRGKWRVAVTAGVAAAFAIAYAFLATEWYRAEVLLVPVEDEGSQGLAAQLGGLAGLAGIGPGMFDLAEPVAVLRSRELARAFIEEQDLLTVLLAEEWDADKQTWKGEDPTQWPDVRDAVEYFDSNVRDVSQDPETGLVTLTIEWIDAEQAAAWANLLVRRLNDQMRSRAIAEAESNIRYLQGELASASVVTLQQAIGRLLEMEMQKLMMARGNEEFSFRVIDSADIPKRRSSPKRVLIIVLAGMLGGFAGVLLVVFRQALKS